MLDLSTGAWCAQGDGGNWGDRVARVRNDGFAAAPSTKRRHGAFGGWGLVDQSAGGSDGQDLAHLVAILGDDLGDRRACQFGGARGEGRDDPLVFLFQGRAALVLVVI